MTETIASNPAASRTTGDAAIPTSSKGLVTRIAGVVTSPRATYAAVAAHPRWLGVLLVIVLVGAAGTYAFLSTEVGRQAMFDQQIRMMESFGVKVTDVMYDRMESRLEQAKYTGPLFQAIFLSLAGVVIAGLALAVFNAILGGDARFKQVFAIVAHSGVILALAQIFGLPLAYARESMSSTTNLGVFLPFLDENSFPARFFGSIDLFQIWWIVSLAIGFGVLYRRRTGPIATTMLVSYAAIALIVAAIRSALSGA